MRAAGGPKAIALAYVDNVNVALPPALLPALDAALNPTLGLIGLEPVTHNKEADLTVPLRSPTRFPGLIRRIGTSIHSM